MWTLQINGKSCQVEVPNHMPLLWVLRDVVGLTATKFGCGVAQYGVCTVHIDGYAVRSCVTRVGAIADRNFTTIEGIGSRPRGRTLQQAWLALQVPQCGYCQPGQIMSAAALLAVSSHPTDAQIEPVTSAAAARMYASARRSSGLRVVKQQRRGSDMSARVSRRDLLRTRICCVTGWQTAAPLRAAPHELLSFLLAIVPFLLAFLGLGISPWPYAVPYAATL